MINLLLETLGTALRLWEHSEKTRYIDRYIKLKKEIDEVLSEGDVLKRDGIKYANAVRELHSLVEAFNTAVASSISVGSSK